MSQKKYADLNKNKILERHRKYRQEHPNKDLVHTKRRQARIRHLPATFSDNDWRQCLEYFNGACVYCGNPPGLWDIFPTLQQDHFIPVIKGGGYTPDNIVSACQTCNYSKGSREPGSWLVERFGPRKAKTILKRIQDYFEWVKDHE